MIISRAAVPIRVNELVTFFDTARSQPVVIYTRQTIRPVKWIGYRQSTRGQNWENERTLETTDVIFTSQRFPPWVIGAHVDGRHNASLVLEKLSGLTYQKCWIIANEREVPLEMILFWPIGQGLPNPDLRQWTNVGNITEASLIVLTTFQAVNVAMSVPSRDGVLPSQPQPNPIISEISPSGSQKEQNISGEITLINKPIKIKSDMDWLLDKMLGKVKLDDIPADVVERLKARGSL